MNIIPGASLPVPGCTGLYLAIPGYTWLYLVVPACIRLYPKCIIPKASLPVPSILVCTWLYLAYWSVPGCTWPYQAVISCTWQGSLFSVISGETPKAKMSEDVAKNQKKKVI